MDYRDKVFLVVAENLSFSKAASELFISQPAVTKHIKELERKLQISVFERKGNRIYLTKAGKLAYSNLKKIEQLYQNMEFEIGRLNDTFKGELTLAASSTISNYILPKMMASFHKRYPKIQLDLISGNSFKVEQALMNNEVNVGLLENDTVHSDLKYSKFMDDELLVVTGVKSIYAKRKQISLSEFKEMPLVLREKGSGTLEVVMTKLKEAGVLAEELNTLIHLGSTEAIKSFLHDFDGIAIVSEQSVLNELHQNRIIRLNVKGLIINRELRVVMRHGYENKLASMFINFVNQYNF
ncbi:LysR substrate-binding domain-containing protein [Saccharicrinis aurantiacus]|uniref:LysR substrate-binding domain-containing protein n=1 Tax=Saccharicrinis aurantiacus TaxID=1849719 RepID=UPI002490BB7E|nr:LysR substrate-binding domain-containing protein [Saccharicrinis aurantiacus]